MKQEKSTGSILVAAFLLLLFSASASGEIFDQIVAVVNDEVITYSELDKLLEPLYRKYEDSFSGPELFEKLQEARWSILNQLIEEKLILQEARKREHEIGEEALMERMEEVESHFSSNEEFQNQLSRSDMTLEEFRELEREKMTAYSMLLEEISKRVMITPQDVIAHYEENLDECTEKEKVSFCQIFIKKGDDAKDDRAKSKLAGEVLERLESGEDFRELAKAYSEGPQKDEGGDWGFIEKGYLNADTMGKIEAAAFELEPGSHSGVIETPLGYHIVMAEGVKKERIVPVTEVWDEIERKLGQEAAERARKEWVSELREKAYISIKQ